MQEIKLYTDLSQSKKLTEILPIESADMWWVALNWQETEYYVEVKQNEINQPKKAIPCWSLAALIDIIENIDKLQKVVVSFIHNGDKYWVDVHFSEFGSFCQDYELYDSKIDALIAMIEKLKNRNLL